MTGVQTCALPICCSNGLHEDSPDRVIYCQHHSRQHDYDRDMSVSQYLKRYEDKTLDEEVWRWICYYGLDDPKAFIKDLEWFLTTKERNAFKGLQLPPAICVHHDNFTNRKLSQMHKDQSLLAAFKQKYGG